MFDQAGRAAQIESTQPPGWWVPIVMYHRIVEYRSDSDLAPMQVTVREFEEQLKHLHSHGYRTVPLAEAFSAARRAAKDQREVILTFDDGYRDIASFVAPLMRKYGFTGTVFLVSDRLGMVNDWDDGRVFRAPLMDLPEVRGVIASGMSVGSHSRTHRRLPHLSEVEAWNEIHGSKECLEDMIGAPVSTFSFPYGASTPQLRVMVHRAGYLAACGVEHQLNLRYKLSRIDASRCRGADLRWAAEIEGVYFRARRNFVVRTVGRLVRSFWSIGR